MPSSSFFSLAGIFSMLVFQLGFLACQQAQTPVATPSRDLFVDSLLAKLSLEEKIGEMTQYAIHMVSAGNPNKLARPNSLDPEKLKYILGELKVGSVLNIGDYAYAPDRWQEIMDSIQSFSMADPSHKIPVLYGIDAIHGASYTVGATLFPQQIGLAATWDTTLALRMAQIAAYETRASGIPWTFSPVCDLGRDPRWPRFWETFGEDVLLASAFSKATVRGYQGTDAGLPTNIAACLKHFLGYSMPWTGKDRTQALIPERTLREYFIPPFQAGIDAGALSVMVCSGEINGIPVHADKRLLTDLLRGEMGFEGVVVSDWDDITFLHTRHRVARDYKEAIQLAINAGIDMAMVPKNLNFPGLLKELVMEGRISMERVDEAVGRILKMKKALGLFERTHYPLEQYPLFASQTHLQAASQAAHESIVLLKNEQEILPLLPDSKILVTGPAANSLAALNGGWTNTWQGNEPEHFPQGKFTILEALRASMGEHQILFEQGSTLDSLLNWEQALQKTQEADVILACLGEGPYTEKPGDIEDMNLPEAQRKLVRILASSGKPIILILAEGRPRIFSDIEPLTEAILGAFLPGSEGAQALADILLGNYNPDGKLPFTYPRFANSLLSYDHKGTDQIDKEGGKNGFYPQFEFGHGLSFTSFEYKELVARQLDSDKIRVELTLKNTGKRAGKEVVQLFVADLVASITPSVKRLRGFQKILLQPGQQEKVIFDLKRQDLAFIGPDMTWITEPGAFKFMAGNQETTIWLD